MLMHSQRRLRKNHYQWGNKHVHDEKDPKKGGLYEVSASEHANAKVDGLF